jgi:hypothetical protein
MVPKLLLASVVVSSCMMMHYTNVLADDLDILFDNIACYLAIHVYFFNGSVGVICDLTLE